MKLPLRLWFERLLPAVLILLLLSVVTVFALILAWSRYS